MAETLGSLCDKLTIIKLKQWHSEDETRLKSLAVQEKQLQEEINEFISSAVSGEIPSERLTFASNKVYKKEGNYVPDVLGTIGEIFSQLAHVNCNLWHEQEKVYEFEKVEASEKDKVVKQLAILNLERNKCIDGIDKNLQSLVEKLSYHQQSGLT
ncbi:hypothetical protein PN499_16015 [Kamptonema animale CS-326]|jgi:hypothetical protein|uniref:hypothetical protein n=1 Tax=Kamptonema animale TaxID=92934 RepID=UPI00232F6F6B|nr:hypothetical protein [Kamptonema animale]MDB9512695.1 hypothetical protein [Kamptonema animale CS-326]